MGVLIIQEPGKQWRESSDCPGARSTSDVTRGATSFWMTPESPAAMRGSSGTEKGGFLEDVGSRNGTLLNRRKLPRGGLSPLRSGDVVQVGRSLIRLVLGISRKITTNLWRSVARRGADPEDAPEESCERERPLSLFRLEKPDARLIIHEKDGVTSRRPLESDRVRIGRSPGSDILLRDSSVADDHAEIVFNREGFHLVDRRPDHGTCLDGVAVRIARLAHRSFIRLGQEKLLFSLGPGRDEPSFGLRDHLLSLHPDRAPGIQAAFRESREQGRDLAEELVFRAVLDPEEWWAAASRFHDRPATESRSWVSRLFGRQA